uniref:Uncharacterized protein n=1 Tax=Arundo donax TaxID=35708 RepID=A0A0A9DPS0_ARUDO
MLAPVRARA